MNQHIQYDWANAAQQFQQLFGESWEKAVQSFQNLDLGTASMPGVGAMPSLTFSPEKLQELQAQYLQEAAALEPQDFVFSSALQGVLGHGVAPVGSDVASSSCVKLSRKVK